MYAPEVLGWVEMVTFGSFALWAWWENILAAVGWFHSTTLWLLRATVQAVGVLRRGVMLVTTHRRLLRHRRLNHAMSTFPHTILSDTIPQQHS